MRMWGRPEFWNTPRGQRGWFPEMGRHFPFGGGPRPRMFERGYLKFALLGLLKEGPKHGYEMMRNLEDRMGGFYAPSAGAIYPTLQLLEDRGWATSATVDGKKVYTITDEGRRALDEVAERRGFPGGEGGFGPGFGGPFGPGFGPGSGPGFGPGFRRGFGLEGGPDGGRHEHGPHRGHHEHHERHERHDGPPWGRGEWGRGGPGFDWRSEPDVRELARQARELGRAFLFAGRASIGRPERVTRLREIIERMRQELEVFMSEQESAPASESAQRAAEPEQGGSGPVENL